MNKIKPHKGGRSERKEVRLTKEEKKLLEKVLKKYGLSFSDWVVFKVNNEKAD